MPGEDPAGPAATELPVAGLPAAGLVVELGDPAPPASRTPSAGLGIVVPPAPDVPPGPDDEFPVPEFVAGEVPLPADGDPATVG